jgi:hypothetical protein
MEISDPGKEMVERDVGGPTDYTHGKPIFQR